MDLQKQDRDYYTFLEIIIMLPDEYISLFSNNENNTNIEFNGDMSGRKDEVLEFVEKPKSLSLIKKNYK